MSVPLKVIFGFHAVGVRMKTAPQSVVELHVDASRRDVRMRQFMQRAQDSGMRIIPSDGLRLAKLCGSHGHQGVVARVQALLQGHSLDDHLDQLPEGQIPLLLVLDGVTDPHNLGACLRVADGAGAHAVIAPKDHAVGLNATVAKVASGAADTRKTCDQLVRIPMQGAVESLNVSVASGVCLYESLRQRSGATA
jgi:23S rRNA (guanosine2251-2'-O)-methyltransferase